MTDPVARIQVNPTDAPSPPSWFGEVAVVAHALQRYGVLGAIKERVRFVRAWMGKYELIDCAAMLIGYAVGGEPTLRAFCERVQPFASEFMALRFVLQDIWDASAGKWSERTRTTILQAHTHQFLGMFGNSGNGQYRQELKQARAVIASYAHVLSFPLSHVVIRLDGLYGDAAPLADLLAAQAREEEGPAVVVRGKAYHLIEQPAIQHRLQRSPCVLYAAPARCGNSVKNRTRRSSRDG